jgi:D-3-phosphoglycerate dehydrogenase
MTIRVLVADDLAQELFGELKEQDVTLDFRPDLKGDALAEAVVGAKILVVRSTKVTEAIICSGDKLALIVRAGSGTNNIDVIAASGKGIFVANCPGRNNVAVAELAMGLILSLDRRIPDNVADLRAGKWDKKTYSKATGIKGQSLGLVGFGSIAQALAKRALAFDMEVSAFSRSLTEEQAAEKGVRRLPSLQHLFRECDVVSLHLPLSENTRGLITADLIKSMPAGAMLINTARAEVVDGDALLAAAQAGNIRVGTDLFENEPASKQATFENPLVDLPNVIGTHHIGASTTQAQSAIAAATVEIVHRFVSEGEVINPVNMNRSTETAGTLVVRHLDRIGVLASVLDRLRRQEINVQTMENLIFDGGLAACARIQLADWPSKETLAEISAIEHVIQVEVV